MSLILIPANNYMAIIVLNTLRARLGAHINFTIVVTAITNIKKKMVERIFFMTEYFFAKIRLYNFSAEFVINHL